MENEPEANEGYNAEAFVRAFSNLCEEYGYNIQPELGFKQQIDGSYTITIRLAVVPIQDNK